MSSRTADATLGVLEGRRGLRAGGIRFGGRTGRKSKRRRRALLPKVTGMEPTQPTILACNCGELVIVLGGEDEWRSEGTA